MKNIKRVLCYMNMFLTSATSRRYMTRHKFNIGIHNIAYLYHDCYFFIAGDFLLPLTDKFTLKH